MCRLVEFYWGLSLTTIIKFNTDEVSENLYFAFL